MKKLLLEQGKVIPLMEEFYSIQGEGFYSGKAAYFIRVAGCDIKCKWCDTKKSWNPKNYPLKSVDDIIGNIIVCNAKTVVVTGGEPLLYNLDYLCFELKKRNIKTFLETSGVHKITGKWDWICLSPKKNKKPLKNIFQKADELKIIIFDKTDLDWAEKNAELVNKNCKLFLQAEWSKRKQIIPVIIDYILKNPKWRISLQSHKYIGIP